ncbi:MAG TPA: FAD/NAD(P)-binding oxidoreductase [Actinomycetota bacterium]|nr:FAD/NAD(P)-binding oxidoreductase [Actinomycetota bacterium]
MAAARVLILGGGFGGLSTAHTLRARAGDAVEVTVVDRAPTFMMGLRKLWFLDGRTTRGQGERPRSGLDRAGITFRQGSVEGINPARREVRVDGDAMPFDFLVVALGAQSRPDLVPGDGERNPNLYSVDGAEEAGRRLAELDRGRAVVLVAGVPYKCPPAAYEAAFLIDDVLQRSKRRDRVAIDVLTPQPMSIPAAGPVACAHIEGRLGTRNIGFRPNAKLEGVEPGRAVLAGGEAVEADLLMVVPPHRPPEVVTDAGLATDGGWVAVDPRTLATEHDGVFAIGDVVEMQTGAGLPFPKAGIFAERHGEVVGKNIAAAVAGSPEEATFDGVGLCFLEIGGGQASFVSGDFLASPPQVTIADPSPEHLESKIAFERERLDRWLPEPE